MNENEMKRKRKRKCKILTRQRELRPLNYALQPLLPTIKRVLLEAMVQ
jgi:hypothetical protein